VCFLKKFFLQGGVVRTSPKSQAGGPPLVGCPRLLIQLIRSYPPYRRPFLLLFFFNAEALVAVTREIGLEESVDKTKYMVMSRDQNAGRIQSVRIDNSTFERVEGFKYLGTTLTNENSLSEEIKSRLRSGNACYHSVQNLLSSRLLSKNLKIKIYRTIVLPVVFYGCEAWSLKLREERKLRMFENMVLRRLFGPRRDEVTGEWRRLHNEE